MKRSMVILTTPALLLGLAACSPGIARVEEDACNRVNAWDIGGREDARFDRAVAAAQEALKDSDSDSLAAAAADLANSAESDRAPKVETFMSTCRDLGWEPPEG